ncbi:MAG: type II toxin-antitoxin system HicA family toxin [Ignavibacteriales bacterium]|nr:type II toxin-antitoxin system HicA family toxin [Ignavibacteriales bacterium]
MKKRKLLQKVLSGNANIRFSEMCLLIEAFGFHLDRVAGSRHIYVHPDIPELINMQKVDGKAKPYQIRQFLAIVERHSLQMGEDV